VAATPAHLIAPEPTIKDENYGRDPAVRARYTDSRRTLALLSGPPKEAGK